MLYQTEFLDLSTFHDIFINSTNEAYGDIYCSNQ